VFCCRTRSCEGPARPRDGVGRPVKVASVRIDDELWALVDHVARWPKRAGGTATAMSACAEMVVMRVVLLAVRCVVRWPIWLGRCGTRDRRWRRWRAFEAIEGTRLPLLGVARPRKCAVVPELFFFFFFLCAPNLQGCRRWPIVIVA